MNRRRRSTLALFIAVALVSRFALADDYDPPADYYNTATGTGTTLKQQLHALIDAVDDPGINDRVETPQSYDSARSSLQVTDADPDQPGHMLAVYDRTSINVAAINPGGSIPGWDTGTTWNREHTWPRSRGVGSSGPDDSDLFEIRPALTANNGDRGNLNYGGAFGQSWGIVSDGGNKWYPGDADAGTIARQEFYLAVRYDGTEGSTTDLELFTGDPTTSQGLGDLNRLLEWNFAAPPDAFERRRNQIIFDNYQNNRNPFTDHPEFVWSIFAKDVSNNPIPNDSQITIAAPTTLNTTDGSSTKIVNLPNVIVGAAVPSDQTVTLNKAGNNGTYYSVTTGGAATSTIAGRFNAFRTNQTDSKTFSVGLNTNTTSAGLRTGTVTIDNLDITAGTNGGVGHAANDANDTVTVNLNVLDHAKPSFAAASQTTLLSHDFGNIPLGGSSLAFGFDVFNLTTTTYFTAGLDLDSVAGGSSAFTTNLATFSNLAAGSSQPFTSSLNVTTVGTFSATYTLTLSDENLSGAAAATSLTLQLTGTVRLAGDYNTDGVVDARDYVVWRHTLGQTGMVAYGGADGDGSTAVDITDYHIWRAHFGETLTSFGSGFGRQFSAVPEPATVSLAAVSLLLFCRRHGRPI